MIAVIVTIAKKWFPHNCNARLLNVFASDRSGRHEYMKTAFMAFTIVTTCHYVGFPPVKYQTDFVRTGTEKNVWERPCTVLHINEHTTHNSLIRPAEGLNLETAASEFLYGAQFTLSTQLTNPYFCVSLPHVPTQHHTFAWQLTLYRDQPDPQLTSQ